MQQNTDMVQSATPDGSVSESRRLDKSTDKKNKKKGAKAPPLFYLFSILSYISYRCDKNTNLVRQKY